MIKLSETLLIDCYQSQIYLFNNLFIVKSLNANLFKQILITIKGILWCNVGKAFWILGVETPSLTVTIVSSSLH